ncbi:MAG: SDR family oxidoreductase [Clostridiales bacterium]|jgi:hypothetical protein|nr:SDR family oxidoreductase [Clostridiales bacterium]
MAVSLITGGAGGIGREISFSFARHGYDVGIHYNQAKERAETLASEIRSIFGVRVQTFHADLSKPAEIAEMFQNAESTLGAPDVLINNAGLSDQRLFTDVSAEDWQRLLDVNLSGTFHTCKCAAPAMLSRKHGAIVNISSIWGVAGASCEVPYSATKSGLIGFTKALARELGPSGIRVNCVAPGVIDTEMNAIHSKETLEALAEETPLCRIGKPHEVAAAVYFLASEEASFITGQTLCVDGGFLQG